MDSYGVGESRGGRWRRLAAAAPTTSRTSSGGDRGPWSRRNVLLWLIVPAMIEIVAWQPLPAGGGPGLEASWSAGLQMATSAQLGYGTHVVFTYGPLGFLYVAASGGYSMWFAGLARIAFAYVLVSRFALAVAVFAGARRSFGTLAGAVIAALALRVAQMPDLPVVLIALVWALGAPRTSRTQLSVAAIASVCAATELLEKVSIGITVAALVLLFVVALPRRRLQAGALALVVGVVTLVCEWIATGQPLSGLHAYLDSAKQASAGYAAAMSHPNEPAGWVVVAALLCVLAGAFAAWFAAPDHGGRRQRVGVVLLWLCFAVAVYREGFVRADTVHLPIFFGAIVCGQFAFCYPKRSRHLGLAGMAVVALISLSALGQALDGVIRFKSGVNFAVADAKTVFSGARMKITIANSRVLIEHTDAVPARIVRLVGHHTMDVFPTELAIAWAYDFNWDPIPVLQSYAAYTPSLDHQDAAFLDSSSAPSRILLQAGTRSIDTRLLSFDEPETSVAIFCHYRVQLATGGYALLARRPDRCGTQHVIGVVHATWGQTVRVPRPGRGSLVLARIDGVQVRGLAALTSVLINPTPRWIRLNSANAGSRLVEANAGDGLPLAASPGVDYPRAYAIAHRARSLSVSESAHTETGGGSITYTFVSVPVS